MTVTDYHYLRTADFEHSISMRVVNRRSEHLGDAAISSLIAAKNAAEANPDGPRSTQATGGYARTVIINDTLRHEVMATAVAEQLIEGAGQITLPSGCTLTLRGAREVSLRRSAGASTKHRRMYTWELREASSEASKDGPLILRWRTAHHPATDGKFSPHITTAACARWAYDVDWALVKKCKRIIGSLA